MFDEMRIGPHVYNVLELTFHPVVNITLIISFSDTIA